MINYAADMLIFTALGIITGMGSSALFRTITGEAAARYIVASLIGVLFGLIIGFVLGWAA